MPADPIRGRRLSHGRAVIAALLLSCTALPHARADDVLKETVKSCAALRRDSERLACYDTRVAPLATAGASDTPPPAPSPEEMFGMDATLAPAAPTAEQAPPAREELASITGQVVMLGERARGEYVVELDNGQVWQQIGNGELLLRVGDEVNITRAAMGSFRLTTPSKRSARVKRIK